MPVPEENWVDAIDPTDEPEWGVYDYILTPLWESVPLAENVYASAEGLRGGSVDFSAGNVAYMLQYLARAVYELASHVAGLQFYLALCVGPLEPHGDCLDQLTPEKVFRLWGQYANKSLLETPAGGG